MTTTIATPITIETFWAPDIAAGPDFDPRLVFLERAAARLTLVETGEMDLDEAISGLLPAFEELVDWGCDTCGEAPCVNPSFCRASRAADAPRARRPQQRDGRIPENWEDMTLDALWQHLNSGRQTSQSTINAIMFCVRARGVAALQEPENLERLERCDAAARKQINDRIERLRELRRD
jgi:hypothetical protein